MYKSIWSVVFRVVFLRSCPQLTHHIRPHIMLFHILKWLLSQLDTRLVEHLSAFTTSKLPVHIFVIFTSIFHTRASFHDVLDLTPIFQMISRRNFHFASFFPCPIPHRTLCYILHYISRLDSGNRVCWYDQSLRWWWWWWWWVFVSLATCTYSESVTWLVHFPDNRELWSPWIRSVVMWSFPGLRFQFLSIDDTSCAARDRHFSNVRSHVHTFLRIVQQLFA